MTKSKTEEKKLRYIDCKISQNKSENKKNTAVIYFYDDVDYFSVSQFKYEFLYLQDMGFEEVIVRINSTGGSVTQGMSVYNLLVDSPMKVTTINDAVAMSMGSIIWSAGDVLKMKDMAILMIHNPYIDSSEDTDEDTKKYIDSIKHQLRTIYSKRFGLSEEVVNSIMDGEEGIDGTYYTAQEAVTIGFLKAENVLETPAILKSKIKKEAKSKTHRDYAMAVAKVFLDENQKKEEKKQPQDNDLSIIGQSTKENNNIMSEEQKTIIALMGLDASADNTAIVNRISALKEAEASNKTMKAKLEELKTIKASLTEKEAEIVALKTNETNANKKIDELQASLKSYQEKEQKEIEDKIDSLIESAVKDGKITEESKALFKDVANNNFERAEQIIAGISPAKQPLSKVIDSDGKNIEDVKNGSKTELERLQEADKARLAEIKANRNK